MTSDELLFLPLGGCREIGMNLNAYAFGPPERRRWLVVDVGLTFTDGGTPGVELVLPDPSYLAERADEIEAIVLTHAHEDHIGAIGWLWPQLRAPIYATPFTAYLVKEKLRERGLEDEAEVHILELGERRTLGPFDIEMVTLTHSIPEPNGIAIRTELGTILHTGDWKIDPDPVIGADFDRAKVQELGREEVLALVCDSTNVFEPGEAGSEKEVGENLAELIAQKTGRVVVTSFASNVARLHSVCVAARKAGRRVALAGRSMWRISRAAQSVGLLTEFDFLEPEDCVGMADSDVLYLCTGSQGEPNAALAKIARRDHQHVRLGKGDTVIFSSRVIPGNERSVGEVQNLLTELGVELITERTSHVHVSGHPCRGELAEMYGWTRPKIAVPVHGERRHIQEHARYARSLQVPTAMTPNNGELIKFAPGTPSIIDEVAVGRLHVEGNRVVPADAESLWERRRLAGSGYVCVVLIYEGSRLIEEPTVLVRGLPEIADGEEDQVLGDLEQAVDRALERLGRGEVKDDDRVERAVVRAVRRACDSLVGMRPLIDVSVHRI